MSTTSYIRNSRVYYITRWSYEKNGIRDWIQYNSFSSNPQDAIQETKDVILYAPLPSFEVKLAGFRIV